MGMTMTTAVVATVVVVMVTTMVSMAVTAAATTATTTATGAAVAVIVVVAAAFFSNLQNMDGQRMIKALLPTGEADNGSACMNCMQSQQHLVRCSACLRVRYCNKACQASDWKRHKPVCKITRVFQRVSRGMPDMPHCGRSKYNMGNKFGRFKMMALGESSEAPRSSSLLAGLPRNSTDVSWNMAKSLVLRSPCCAICKKSDYDYDILDHCQSTSTRVESSTEWKCCSRCNRGWCCAEHFEEYRPRHTTEICNTHIRATKIQRFQYNHTVKKGNRFSFMPESPLSAPMEYFPKTWDEYFRRRTPTEYGVRDRLPKEFFPAATFLLSQVNTCLHGMYQHDREFFTTAKELTIHVVGPTAAFEYEGGAPTRVWEEIMHCLPNVRRMNVIFTGPEGMLTFPLTQMGSCPDCTTKGRVRMQGFHDLAYYDYYASDDFINPDFVVAFNTGMYEVDTESWKESLRVMMTLDVPCLFTSYNKYEGDADFEVLTEVNARTLTDASVLNPFRVDIPLVDDGCIDKFFQCNMYCICFRGCTTEH